MTSTNAKKKTSGPSGAKAGTKTKPKPGAKTAEAKASSAKKPCPGPESPIDSVLKAMFLDKAEDVFRSRKAEVAVMAGKAGEVLQYLVKVMAECEAALASIGKGAPAGADPDIARIAKLVDDSIALASKGGRQESHSCDGCEGCQPRFRVLTSPEEAMVTEILSASKYRFPIGMCSAKVVRDSDDGQLRLHFEMRSYRKDPSGTRISGIYETRFSLPIFSTLDATVKAFDDTVAHLGLDLPLKEPDPPKEEPLSECDPDEEFILFKEAVRKCFEDGIPPSVANLFRHMGISVETGTKPKAKSATKPQAKAKVSASRPAKDGTKAVAPDLKDFKDMLVRGSRFPIPPTRFDIVASGVDRKHGNYVYEVRVYPKSVRSFRKGEKLTYSKFRLPVRKRGEPAEVVCRRFDLHVARLGMFSPKGK